MLALPLSFTFPVSYKNSSILQLKAGEPHGGGLLTLWNNETSALQHCVFTATVPGPWLSIKHCVCISLSLSPVEQITQEEDNKVEIVQLIDHRWHCSYCRSVFNTVSTLDTIECINNGHRIALNTWHWKVSMFLSYGCQKYWSYTHSFVELNRIKVEVSCCLWALCLFGIVSAQENWSYLTTLGETVKLDAIT